MMHRRTFLSATTLGLITSAVGGVWQFSMSRKHQDDIAHAYRLLNDARLGAGRVQLSQQPILETLAQHHTVHMQTLDHVTHLDASGDTPDRRAAKLGYTGHILGEALAETYGSTDDTMTYWLDHPTTRAVLMDQQAREVGLARTTYPGDKAWWAMVVSKA